MRRILLISLLSCIWLLGLSNDIPTDIEKVNLKLEEGEFAITFLDLSSGEVTLIQHSNGENILINTGGPNTEKELKRILETYGISTIESIIITKVDPEYTSNFKWLTDHFKDVTIIAGHHSKSLLRYEEIQTWKKGDQKKLLPGLEVDVIQESPNQESTIGMDILFSFGEHKMLYMTSSNKMIEKSILNDYDLSSVNILKIGDFASSTGTSQRFLEHVDPQVAIIFQKKGALPSQDVIERLQETWIDIYFTKQFGNISLKCTNKDYEIITLSIESNHLIE